MANKKVVILGTGPTGLVSALRLSREAGYKIELIEKEPLVGGISATFRHGEFLLDIGTHRFYGGMFKDAFEWIKETLGEELLERPRNCKIYFMHRFVAYPFSVGELLCKIGPLRAFRFLGDYVKEKKIKRDLTTYEGYMLRHFGRDFYDNFYRPYAKKVWGIPLSMLSFEQAVRRVNVLSLKDILARILKGELTFGNYFYPKHGIGTIWEIAKDELVKRGIIIHTSARAEKFINKNGRINAIEYLHNDKKNVTECDYLVSTIPVTDLVNGITPLSGTTALNAARRLKYRALIVLYLILKTPAVSDKETYYFPSEDIPFNRVYEQKNYSPYTGPKNKTCLGIEITCDKGDSVWGMEDEELFESVRSSLEELGLVKPDDVDEYFSRKIENAYPVYEINYRKHLKDILEEVGSINNLITNGRQGLFIHQNMHHSIRMGIVAAEHVIGNKNGREWCRDTIKEFDSFKVFD